MKDCCAEAEATRKKVSAQNGDRPPCPACGFEGQKVGLKTIRSLLRSEVAAVLTEGDIGAGGDFYLCRTPACDVAYYADGQERVIPKRLLKVPIWFKEQGDDVPICYCSNLSRARILEAVREGYTTIADIRAHTGATRTGECAGKNPTGKCCHQTFQALIDAALGR